ncbi:MAG: BACON domain-containing protein [Bacteroidales bacterium]|nr:BACON domain-containing protein [Bacteroidales bacterium]
MKKRTHFLMAALLAVVTMCFVGCKGPDDLHVNTQDVWFGLEAGTQTIEVTANCEWTVTHKDDASWYTISPMTGKKDGTITVTVEPLEGSDFRSSSFVVTSPKGHIRRTVFVSQNKLDFDGMMNKVFGVMHLEHWNTDFWGEIIEDTYQEASYNPYDTTTGYHVYFLPNGEGIQRDHHTDTIAYWPFHYEYNPLNQVLHIDYELVDNNHEDYDCNVVTASDSLFRFIHEFEDHGWERADMRKVGTINPEEMQKLMTIKRDVPKRKKGQPIFIMD